MKGNNKYQIYCDMDGVLVDFESAVIAQINEDIKDTSITCRKMKRLREDLSNLDRDFITVKDLDKINKDNRLKSARRYMFYRCSNDEDLWANLPWTKDGKELWEYISKFEPHILTAPMDDEGCRKGKHRWIKDNLSPQPEKIFMSHDKYNWATYDNGQPNILIDDFTINTVPWEKNGGTSILYINASKAIKELKELLE